MDPDNTKVPLQAGLGTGTIPTTGTKATTSINMDPAPSSTNLPSPSPSQSPTAPTTDTPDTPTPSTRHLWFILTPLLLNTFMAAIESTIIASALPLITTTLHAGPSYPWFVNGYLLTKTAFIPLWGQLASVAGRKIPIQAAVALFIIGSGIAGGADTPAVMIVGRCVQGLGGGGMTILGQLIISDLVPPREVPKYVGYLFGSLGVGTAVGPFLGGVMVERGAWRWVFWVNLPVGGVALVLQWWCLRGLASKGKGMGEMGVREKLRRVDFVGNGLIVAATALTLIALSWGGAVYGWGTGQVMGLLVVGVVGLVGALCYEAWAPWVKEPTIYTVIFRNYSTDINLFLAFMQFMFMVWTIYFLPVYFQGVLLKSAEMAGVLLLPTVVVPLALAIIVGRLITRWGRYRIFHVVGFALVVMGYGLFTMFDERTSIAVVIVVQVVWSFGMGQLMTSTLPGVQASVEEKLRSPATSTWGFFREFGGVWGTAVPGAIFNSRFGKLVGERITDIKLRDRLSDGNGFSFASAKLIRDLDDESRKQVIGVFTDSCRLVFRIAIGLSGLCLICAAIQKEYELRKTHKSDFGLKTKGEKPQENS